AGAARGILEAVLLPVRFRPFATRDEAIAALRGGAIDRFYLVPADYLATGRVESYLPDEATLGMAEKRAERSLERLLARSLLAGRLPEEFRARVETPVDSRRSAAFVVGASGRPEPLDTGVLGTNSRESQQLAAIWSIAAILPPSAAAVSILDEPNGIVARVLGWFPLTAPITMMIRCGTGKVPLWDLLLAIALLAGAVYL